MLKLLRLLILLPALTACSAWAPVSLPTPTNSAWAIRHRMRVTDSAGTTTVGLVAVVRDSSLIVTGLDSVDRAFPLGSVRLLEREHMSATAKILLIGTGLLVVRAIQFGADKHQAGAPPGPCWILCDL